MKTREFGNGLFFNELLKFLYRKAPQATIKECVDYAEKYESAFDDMINAKTALAVLCEVLGCDKNGKLPSSLIDRYRSQPAVLWALWSTVQSYCDVGCSPLSGGMENLKATVEKEVKRGKFELPTDWLVSDKAATLHEETVRP